MNIDFNAARLSACENMDVLIRFLNSHIDDGRIEMTVDSYIDEDNRFFKRSLEELIDDLRSNLLAIGFTYSATNNEIANIADQINIASFNYQEEDEVN